MPMTSRQRLLAAIHHQEADVVPNSPSIWPWNVEYYGHGGWLNELRAAREFDYDPLIRQGDPCPNYVEAVLSTYSDLEDVRVEVTVRHEGERTLMERVFHTPAGRLSDRMVRYPPGKEWGIAPNPHWEERLVKDERDLDALAYLLPTPTVAMYEPTVAVQDAIGERGMVNLYIHPTLDHRAGWAYELVDLMVAAIEQPQFVHRLLRLFQEHTLACMRCACEAGVELIFTAFYFASLSAGWSPRLYKEFFLPLVREQVDLVHSYDRLYWYFDDGKCAAYLPWLADCGVDMVETLPPPPMGDVILSDAKRTVGDRLCLCGGVDSVNVLSMGTPEQVREAVRQAILDAAPGGGFILGSSDGVRDTPLENMKAYFQAAREFGDYRHLGRA